MTPNNLVRRCPECDRGYMLYQLKWEWDAEGNTRTVEYLTCLRCGHKTTTNET